uniref:adenosylmethionine decarboxylase n=1 Tax=Romanomermis culicivorax TaxID=13658 RepID=A0A915HRU8_ROMCU
MHYFINAGSRNIWFDTTHKDVSDDEDDALSSQNGSSCGDNRSLSLRSIPRHQLDFLVELAHAQIIGNVSNARVDSYVLSESSLFVSDRRLILKTCGTTSLLSALGPLLQMARDYCGLDIVASCNYSRRNFTRPELQPSFHQHFEEEIQILTEILQGGAGYCMGKINQDRWYLFNYTADEPCRGLKVQDQTVEVLMSNLDPEVMKIFTRQISSSAVEARKLSGIDKLMPVGSLIDDKLFDPCGYSLNSLFADKDEYYTIHITPEADYSYVSFETNAHRLNYTDLVQQVVDTFKPGTFLVTLYGNQVKF